MPRKSKKSKNDSHDIIPWKEEQPQLKKKFHLKDLNVFNPLTNNQRTFFEKWVDEPEKHFFLSGFPGTGKTFNALYLSTLDLLREEYEKIIIIRSAVPSRDTGFLPGTLEEKLAVYEEPYIETFDKFFKFSKSYENLVKLGKIQFASSSYLRGVTFDDSIIFIDEVQSMTYHELFTILSRTGENSRVVISGDFKQNDLYNKRYEESCFVDLEKLIDNMKSSFIRIDFKVEDIVRSKFVRDLIIADSKL